jgi:WhiB family transcriptional regulator, redox-sensing transcriptional regulator
MIGITGLIGLESAGKAGISPMSTGRPGYWRQLAACRHAEPELFFPVSATGPSRDQVAEAKAICFGCQVRHQCLAFALDTRQEYGVWGGLSEQERREQVSKTCTRL